LPESNDGTVSIASQLYPAAQAAARSIRGFDETHVGILDFEPAAKWVQSMLLTDDAQAVTKATAAPLGK
ncbi:MAG TPA: hypothetical protein VFJ90_12530, partial [Candidatus Didemnitutus sp.]|nr:hypothetical protein [Candidatus Didemnitutus sp.]